MEKQMKKLKKKIEEISKLPKLKPCPFCGNKKIVIEQFLIYKSGEPTTQYLPFCHNKKCLFGQMAMNEWMHCEDRKYDSMKKAIEAWNKRPTEEKLIKQNRLLNIDLNRKD